MIIAERPRPAPLVAIGDVPRRAPLPAIPDRAASRYQPSRRHAPVTLIVSVALVIATMAVIATVNPGASAPRAARPLVVTMNLLPPPPPRSAPPPSDARPTAAAPAVAPPPQVPLTVATPIQTAPAPAPPAATEVVKAAPAPVPAPAAAPSVENGDLTARMIAADPPSYPLEARRHHEQGTVKLLVLVGLDGRVDSISIADSSGSDRLDRAALAAVKRWRWTPVSRNGAAVMVRGTVTIPFVLRT